MITKIKNAVFITDRLCKDKNLYIENDVIKAFTGEELPFDKEIDAEGMYVSPGFIDIHTHGAGGYDFADGTVEDILGAAMAHAEYGTTTVYPTSASMSFDDTLGFVLNVKKAMEQNAPGKPHIAGSHLEGPYFSQEMRGAQNPEYVKNPVESEYVKWVESGEGTVKRVSFAPELDGAMGLCKYLAENGVTSGFAHTQAIYEEIVPFIDAGCTVATHIYSGMNTVTRRGLYRKLGAVETAFLDERVTAEVIADGIHLPPELLKLIFKIKGPEKICLVTDSMRGAAMENGNYVLGPVSDGMECTVKDGVAFLPDFSAFAGSVATSNRLVRVMHEKAGVSLTDCIKMLCENPARLMNIPKRGKIQEGFYADLVFFDGDINVKKVLIEGKELTK